MKILHTCTDKIKPTQICVGHIEVADKIKKLKQFNSRELEKYQQNNPLPAVAGPQEHMFIIDHHHLGKAYMELKIKHCCFIIKHDFSTVSNEEFFEVMKTLKLLYPYEKGVPKNYSDIPHCLSGLKDDPYRSLAGFVRKAGGYEKVDIPYLEFAWADFFRPLIPEDQIVSDIKSSTVKAIQIAKSIKAKNMMGWLGDRPTL